MRIVRYRKRFWIGVAATLTFWLILPIGLYVVAGGLASWQANRIALAA